MNDLKVIVERFCEEAWVKGTPEIFDEILSPDFTYYDPAAPEIQNREQYKQWIMKSHTLIRNVVFEFNDMIVEGEKIAVRYTYRADYKTGHLSHDGIAIYWFVDGCVQELWDLWDAAGISKQVQAIEKQAGV